MSQPSYSPQHMQAQRPHKKGVSGLMIALIIAGVLGFFFLLAVGGLIYFVGQARNDSDVMKTVFAKNRSSQLEMPSNWTEITGVDRSPDASIQYGNMLGEKYAMVVTETKASLYDAFGNEEFSFDDFVEIVKKGMTDQNFQVGSSTSVTVDGLPGQRIRVAADVDGIPIVYIMTLLESDKNFHQVNAWTLTSREKQNMPILMKVSDSFKEL